MSWGDELRLDAPRRAVPDAADEDPWLRQGGVRAQARGAEAGTLPDQRTMPRTRAGPRAVEPDLCPLPWALESHLCLLPWAADRYPLPEVEV